ncbi:MAG TPA: hypothetical protein VJ326_04535 [Thermoplasmata archaeon]|nr:hypothetical protein [Thermoplasmata archaeon]
MIPVVRSSMSALGAHVVAAPSGRAWNHGPGRVPPWIVATGAAAAVVFVLILLG